MKKCIIIILMLAVSLAGYSQKKAPAFADLLLTNTGGVLQDIRLNEDDEFEVLIELPRYYNIEMALLAIVDIVNEYSNVVMLRPWEFERNSDGMPYYGAVLLITDDNLLNTEWVIIVYSVTKKRYLLQFPR